MNRTNVLLALIFIIVLLISSLVVNDLRGNINFLNGFGTNGYYYVPRYMNIVLSDNYSMNATVERGSNYYLILSIPQNSSYQTGSTSMVYGTNVTPQLYNQFNLTYYKFKIGGGSNYVNLTFNFTTYGYDWHNLINVNSTVGMIPEYLKNEYDHPEYFNYTNGLKNYTYEVIDPSFFRNLTVNLTKNYSTVVGKLEAIYYYIEENYRYNISYNFGNIPLTAVQVYQRGEGDCEELSYLFESMARSIGIPAWTQYGILINKDGNTYSVAEHAWVQTYIPINNTAGRFVTIDTTVEAGKPSGQILGLGFLVKYPNELTLWTDDGNSSHMAFFHIFLEYPEFGVIIKSINQVFYVMEFSQFGQIPISGNVQVIINGVNTIYNNKQEEN